ncbi:MAG TPA: iron-containing alcohol dehydrogenase [Candidatus Blautia pullicola]|uniref:Iron-containing alcohol dehydrogenase n=1 Tax=Candidatus Blautia pullicola TaxID=2838498 RepID=A0A9D2FSY6_9FIRM|nr:iron-containing alcohol dehydrogenase [Candidatus Blautia pullicola]
MNSFEFQFATKMIFGKDKELCVGEEIKALGGTRVLMAYGGNSIKRSGLYDRVIKALDEAGLMVWELPGVVPNPRVSLVRKGIEICREEKIDFLLAVGGGSVIDTCKSISFGVFYEGDVWDLITGKSQPGTKRIPVGDILTIPAAGSEGSDSCVISDETISVKAGFGSPLMRPVFSIMNPELTFTLPPYQTACGGMDIMAHAMERYFSHTESVETTDRMAEGFLKTLVHNLPIVLENPEDYGARAEIMLCGTFAQNDMTGVGREQDWFNHGLEHQISGFYDLAHGAGLGISFPAWMEYLSEKKECTEKLAQYAVRVWNVEMDFRCPEKTAKEGARRLKEFVRKSGLPLTLQEAGIGTERFEEIADNMTDKGQHTCGAFYPMTKQDILDLLNLMK